MKPFAPSALALVAVFFICTARCKASRLNRGGKNITWLPPGTESYEGNYSLTTCVLKGPSSTNRLFRTTAKKLR
jgi:hypothetical protein